jgi:flavorubredoxin
MKITNSESNTSIAEIGDGIYRISTPVPPNPALPAGFTFNQFLIDDDEPLLFHTGLRGMFPLVREAIDAVVPVSRLRYLGISHFEADECGALNELLEVAPHAVPICSAVAKMVSVDDVADREAMCLGEGEQLSLGRHTVEWIDAPHLPHGWDCGYLFERESSTLFCGDLFTQPGADHLPLIESDILGPSEAMRGAMDYYAHAKNTGGLIAKLAANKPTTLACMHGSSWSGNGSELLGQLAAALA